MNLFQKSVSLLVLLLLISGCSQDPLDRVQREGVLTVAMRNTPAAFYEHREGHAGFEYELIKGFAQQLGVELRVVRSESQLQMEQALAAGEVDMLAGGLGLTLDRMQRFSVTEPLLQTQQMLVYRRGHFRPRQWEDIPDDAGLAVLAGSRQAEVLRVRQAQQPSLSWMQTEELEVTDLLKLVEDGDLDFALIDAQDYSINRFFFPRVGIAFEVDAPVSLVWLLPQQPKSSALSRAANAYIQQIQQTGKLAEVRDRYYRHEAHLEYVGAPLFLRHVRNRLPRYETHFREAAQVNDFDWLLLAAVGFQESHWRHNAVSPTGVRGLMMLTQRTARELGVNRLDPYESIEGGARYLRSLYDRLPERIQGPDRLYMALAAYNVGMGHLEDARRITQSQGYNPDLWDDVAKHLPLLSQRQWHRHTRFGYARGNEPVVYVHNIRRYLEILEWHALTQQDLLEQLEERASRVQLETAFSKVSSML